MNPRGEPIVISGVGLRSSVGNHAAQSAASVRAGINRFAGWQQFGVEAEPEGGVVAAFLRPPLPDSPWIEKALGLLQMPLLEALAGAELFDLRAFAPGRVRAYLGVPYPDRGGLPLAEFQQFAEGLGEDAFSDAEVPLELLALDQVGSLAAVARASEALQGGKADVCIVGGLDSLLDSDVLQQLVEDGRLKLSSNSEGLIPGEAAAFVVLETARSAKRRGVSCLARVDAVALEQELPWTPEAPVKGQALSRALRTVLAAVSGQVGTVVTDLNGERWRFLEWALMETRCLGALPRGWRHLHPADCLGDVGAAHGAVALVLAVRAFARGYAQPGSALIAASSTRGERGALTLSPPGAR